MIAEQEEGLNLEIHTSPLVGSALARDHLAGANQLSPFFSGHPFDLVTYQAKIEDLDRRFGAERRRQLASLIRATSRGAEERLHEVVAGDGFFVTTGQQPGLFGGPLYTVHKILSAIHLAAALESELGRPVVPLFWVASDDHDWEEANHLHLIDRGNELRWLGLEGEEEVARSMRRRLLGPEIEGVIDDFIGALPSREFADELIELLREAYRPDQTVAGAFTELIAQLFAPFDLLLVDGGAPGVKELSLDLLEAELEAGAEHERLLESRAEALAGLGYQVQVPILPGAINIFYEDEGGRDRLYRDGEGFMTRGSARHFTRAELRRLMRDEPQAFSANVLLRPVVESHLFPTLAYVGGPGEVSYFAQLSELFRAHQIEPPVVFPRFSVTIVEGKVRQTLDRFGLEIPELAAPFHELSTRVVRDEMPTEVRERLDELRCRIEDGYALLEEPALQIDPMLAGPLQSGRNASLGRLRKVEKKIIRHLKLQKELDLRRLEIARTHLFPGGQPQERLLNIIQYLARYGQELLPALGAGLEVTFR